MTDKPDLFKMIRDSLTYLRRAEKEDDVDARGAWRVTARAKLAKAIEEIDKQRGE